LTLADQAVVSGVNFLTAILIGRAVGKEGLGLFVLGFTIVQLILCLQQALITDPYTVYAGREPDGSVEYAGSLLVHSGLLALLASLVFAGLSGVFRLQSESAFAPLLTVLAVTVPFLLLREFGRRHAFAHLRFFAALVLDLATAILQLGGLIWLSVAGQLTAVLAHGVAGAACAVAGVAWLILARNELRLRWPRVVSEWRRSWAFGSWVLASNGLCYLSSILMTWLLLFLGISATGLYSGLSYLVNVCNPFLLGMNNLATPLAANARNRAGMRGLRRVVWQFTVLLALALGLHTLLVAVFGNWAAGVLLGPDYVGHLPVLILLALIALATGLSLGSGIGLWALDRSDINFVAALAAFVVGLLAAALFLPLFGVLGAALAGLASAVANSGYKIVAFIRLSGQTESLLAEGAEA